MMSFMTLNEILHDFGLITPKEAMAVILKLGDQTEHIPCAFETDFAGLRYRGHTTNLIDRQVFFLGSYERGILRLMEEILSARGRPVFVDVGANVGVHTLFASRLCERVVAFEPWRPVRDRLAEHVALNHLLNVIVRPEALGAVCERRSFYEPLPENLGMGTFVPELQNATNPILELDIVPGTEAFALADIERVDLIKVDVEGFEYEVLTGLLPFLRTHRPVLIFEYSRTSQERFQEKNPLTLFLSEHYDLEGLRHVNSTRMTREPWHPKLFGNVLARPK